MKNYITAIALAFALGSFAQASDLIKITTGGGMPGPGGPSYRSITVDSSGNVISARVSAAHRTSAKVAKLSKAAVDNLKKQIEDLKSEDLKAPADGPRCEDAPSTSVAAIKADGTEVEIYRNVSCRESEMDSAYTLVRISKGIQSLVYSLGL